VAGGHVEGTVFCGKDTFSGFPDVRDFEAILRQFRGMRIGVPGKGSIHDVILQESLQRFRLKKDIAVTNFPWADQVTEAMVKNEISAAFGTPALAVAVRRFAGGRILYPPSLLWPHNPSYGILVDKGYLHAHQEIVGQFLRAHEQATFLIRNRPAAAARIISDHLGFIEEDFVLETLRISPKYCAQLTGEYVASAMGFVKILRDLSYIAREIPVADIFERSLINSIHPEKDHYENGIALA
jgi:NitT/TauT family transport system substrate-binding protein